MIWIKYKSYTKVIEGSTENKSFSALWLGPKFFFPAKKIALKGPKKAKYTSNLSQNQMLELKET